MLTYLEWASTEATVSPRALLAMLTLTWEQRDLWSPGDGAAWEDTHDS